MAVQNFGAGGGFQLSPGLNVSEVDLIPSAIAPTSASAAAFAGVFRWGPLEQRVLVSSETDLVRKFGRPTNLNAETFFTAASFLSYASALYVSRAGGDLILSAVASSDEGVVADAGHSIKNRDDFDAKVDEFDPAIHYIARYPGELGNSLKISVCDTAAQYESSIGLVTANTDVPETGLVLAVGSNTATVTIANSNSWAPTEEDAEGLVDSLIAQLNVGDRVQLGNNTIGRQSLKITAVGEPEFIMSGLTFTGVTTFTIEFNQSLKLSDAVDTTTIKRFWEYANQFDTAPGQSEYVALYGNTAAQDEMHVVVVDSAGSFTGDPGAVLEVYRGLSRATDAKLADGSGNFYKNVINDRSQYVWCASDRDSAASELAAEIASSGETQPLTIIMAGGTDENETDMPFTEIAKAYDTFVSTEDVDVALVITGKSRGGADGTQLANYLIDNLAEVRRDCVVFCSPTYDDVVNQRNDALDNVLEFRASMRSSSFAFLDSGYKYMYDKYNDLYRWVPLNGDTAGTCVFTDRARDPWFSPAGTSRGMIRNVVKLAFNPRAAERDELYKKGVNPVITQPGQGTMLFGDKTLLDRAGTFDRINVRRLFIVLEKAISGAAKSLLFEFNDEFTRTQFVNLVEPFLRDIQGRRGIYDFKVICDETNNTPEVIDSNRFVGDIYVKPAKSINYIQLNFVAVRTGVQFSELVG